MTAPHVSPQMIEQCVIGTLISLLRRSQEDSSRHPSRRHEPLYFFQFDGLTLRLTELLDTVLMDYAVLGVLNDKDQSDRLRSDILVSLVLAVKHATVPGQIDQETLLEALTDIFFNGTEWYTNYGARAEAQ